jgi:hypothetical protein
VDGAGRDANIELALDREGVCELCCEEVGLALVTTYKGSVYFDKGGVDIESEKYRGCRSDSHAKLPANMLHRDHDDISTFSETRQKLFRI